MQIKMSETLATITTVYVLGKTYDVPDAEAKAWIAGGIAVAVKAEKPATPPTPPAAPTPETPMVADKSTAKAVQVKAKPKAEAKPEAI